MTDEPRWVVAGSFSTGLDADIARQMIEDAGIPVLLKDDRAGILGVSFQGPVSAGVDLAVPESDLERARELLDTDD